jgi:hypothetical protein
MVESNITEVRHRTPAIVKDARGRERIENHKWSLPAVANYVSSHPESLHTAADLCRVANEIASKGNVERRRRELSKIADYMLEELKVPAVLEWGGRKIVAITRYNPQDEYHQRLMAEEINRRTVRADGSAERLEALVHSLPHKPIEESND